MPNWPHIVRQHGPAVWKTAVRLLRQTADAEDCFQETFVHALAFSREQEVQNWPALLKHLATRRALEVLRRRRRQAERQSATPTESLIDDKRPLPDAAVLGHELAERLRVALTDLDTTQAEVFCLARIEGMSYAEIAERLQLSVNHVGVLLNRARTALRRAFNDEESSLTHNDHQVGHDHGSSPS